MTEVEWLAAIDPTAMLEFLSGRVTPRKLRLLACACCRRIWHLLEEEGSRSVIEIAERHADGEASPVELATARTLADERHDDLRREEYRVEAEVEFDSHAPKYRQTMAELTASQAVSEVVAEDLPHDFLTTIQTAAFYAFVPSEQAEADAYRATLRENVNPRITAVEAARQARRVARDTLCTVAMDAEAAVQARILRDLMDSPFAPARKGVAYPPTAVRLARSVYADRAFGRLPILADALEEAGCTDAELLTHCRQPGEHWRGCWVVDLILGKE
jgi:hypothetical protein